MVRLNGAVLPVFEPGSVIVVEERWRGRLWSAEPHRVISSDPARLLTEVPAGTVGLVATITWGTIVGSLLESPTAGVGMTFIPISLLVGISGIFYPITALPGWVQGLAQVFPVYWLGLGMRSALLPDTAAAIEIAGSWRSMETAGVLGLWALVGLVIAPPVLRRMARRESGSVMEARKQQALRRYT